MSKITYAYQSLLQIRDLDNQLMWTRSNIILIVHGGLLAILASKFDMLFNKHLFVLFAICLFGMILSFLGLQITKGSFFWVHFWQGRLKRIEHLAIGKTKIFRNHPNSPKHKKLFRKAGYISTHKTLRCTNYLMIALWGTLLAYVSLALCKLVIDKTILIFGCNSG